MTLTELARLVKTMRDVQDRYFRTRQPSLLHVARDMERRVDAAVKNVLHPPTPDLFEEEPCPIP